MSMVSVLLVDIPLVLSPSIRNFCVLCDSFAAPTVTFSRPDIQLENAMIVNANKKDEIRSFLQIFLGEK